MRAKKEGGISLDLPVEPSMSELLAIEEKINLEASIDVNEIGDDSDDILRKYLNEISLNKRLSREDEILLAKKIKNSGPGSKKALKELVDANLRLVAYCAYKHSTENHLKILDCIQEGNIGLLKAIRKYDWEKGFRFSTYAIWWIQQSIMMAKKDNDKTIRIPVHAKAKLNLFFRQRQELSDKLCREATVSELADYCRLTEEVVLELISQSRDVLSLNKMASDDGDEIQAFVPDSTVPSPEIDFEGQEFRRKFRNALKESLKNCSRTERSVFACLYLRQMSLRQASKKIKIPLAKVQKIQISLKTRLKVELKKFAY